MDPEEEDKMRTLVVSVIAAIAIQRRRRDISAGILRISLPELLSLFLCSQCTGAAVGRVGLNLQDDEIAPAVGPAKHPRDAGK